MKKIPSEIIKLYKLGFAIHWLRPKSKMPINKGWTSGPRQKLSELKKKYQSNFNFGVRLGNASKIGDYYLAVLDVDIKSENPLHNKEAIHKLFSLFPQVTNSPSIISGRGNGSAHYYVKIKQPVSGDEVKARSTEIVRVKMPSVAPSQKERDKLTTGEIAAGIRLRPAWEIALLSEGRQTVLAGSVHPDTGLKYKWKTRIESSDDIPVLNLKLSGKPPKERPGLMIPPADKKNASKFEFVNVNVQDLGLREDQILAITEGIGVTDRSAEVFALSMALLQRKVSDEKIISLFTRKDFFLGNVAYDHAHTSNRMRAANWFKRYCLNKAKIKVNDIPFDIEEIPKAKKKKKEILPQGIVSGETWEKDLETRPGAKGKAPIVKATYINLRLILANRVENAGFLKHDQFRLSDFYTCNTPWGSKKGDQRSGGHEDALNVKNWLSREYGIEPSITMIDEVLNTVSLENAYHPLRDYLNSLEWDGVERVEKAFKNYLGAEMPEPYLSEVTRKFFLACVKRAFEPGCKFDHVVVLEGFQGLGKSTFANVLAGKNWFLDGLPNFNDKDAALYLQGTWICELSELAAIYKSANETTKSFISRTVDRFRPPYGQRRIDFPRTTVFLGTTNFHDYLTDSTGNRRFWPIFVKKCDFEGIQKDRDQLWAEAMFNYTYSSEPLFLVGDSRRQALTLQELRRVEDEGDKMQEKLRPFLKTHARNLKSGVSISELFDGPFIDIAQTSGNMRRAAEILRKAGFRKQHTKQGNKWFCY